jgi:hypothetical protein
VTARAGDGEVAAQRHRRNLLRNGKRRNDLPVRGLRMPMRQREMEAAK